MVHRANIIPKAQGTTYGMHTSTVSVDSYRGAGKPEATYMLERALEDFAREIHMDPVEVRRLNFAKEEEFPFTNAQGLIYDSGDYDKALNKALEMADHEKLRAEQKEARKSIKK